MMTSAEKKPVELEKENEKLLELVAQLGKIIVGNVAGQRAVLDIQSEFSCGLNTSMGLVEILPNLREIALQCAHAARDCSEVHSACELEGISVQLAEEAEKLESIFCDAA